MQPVKDWTQSSTNQKVTPRRLRPEQVRLEDIPHSLAQKVRFSGQTQLPLYSVAQHCILGARLLPATFKLPFLLHEVSEVYLPDVPAPLKPFVFVEMEDGKLIPWTELEAQHARAVMEALGLLSLLPLLESPEVKRMDLAMLAAEKEQKMGEPPEDWNLSEPAADVLITPMKVEDAIYEWQRMFDELTSGAR